MYLSFRLTGHFTLLRQHRFGQLHKCWSVNRSPTNCSVLPDHADPPDLQVGPSLHRLAKFGIYHSKQLQRVGSTNALHDHFRTDFCLAGLCLWKGRVQHHFQWHVGLILVGPHYNDHRKLTHTVTNLEKVNFDGKNCFSIFVPKMQFYENFLHVWSQFLCQKCSL